MRTLFSTTDLKEIIDTIFNGNKTQHILSNGTIPYDNPNSETIILKNEDGEVIGEVDLAEYLNVKFYTWKHRTEPIDTEASGGTLFSSWADSLDLSLNQAHCLIEKLDEEFTPSQDIDSALYTGRATFIIQADKVPNLDYYISKLKKNYIGNPQEIQNSYGNIDKTFIVLGCLEFEQEPFATQYGECVIASMNFTINYLANALTYSDMRFQLSFDGDTESAYNDITLTRATIQNIFSVAPLIMQERPDLMGYVADSLTNVCNISFFDFDKPLNNRFNQLFWGSGCYSHNGVISETKDVNIPVYLKVTINGDSYVYKYIIVNMQKDITNNEFNINSLSLKNWGKIS